jgi:transketolase
MAKYKDVEVRGVGITEVPRSGQPDELLEKYGISWKKIMEKVKEMI